MKRTIIFVAATVAIAVGYYFSMSMTDAPLPTTPLITPPAVSNLPIASGMPKGYQANESIRDPFAAPDGFRFLQDQVRSTALADPKSDSFVKDKLPILTGVARSGQQQVAILRQGLTTQSYGVNDYVGKYKLVAINNDSVMLAGPEGNLVLSVGW